MPLGMQSDPYAVWLSEIMLQQTQAVTVKTYYTKFLKKWPNVHELAAASLDDVLNVWQGLGYYTRVRKPLLWSMAASFLIQKTH